MWKKISLILTVEIFKRARSQTFWKSQDLRISIGEAPAVDPPGMARISNFIGKSPYYILGERNNYWIYETNIEGNARESDFLKNSFEIPIANGILGNIDTNDDFVALIGVSGGVARVVMDKTDITNPITVTHYPVESSNGEAYNRVSVSLDGSFGFAVQTKNGLPSTSNVAYKLSLLETEILLKFNLNGRRVGTSVYGDSPFVIFTTSGSDPRDIFDHTQIGPVLQYSDRVTSHQRTFTLNELSILCLQDFQIYLTGGNENIYKTNFSSGEIINLYNVPDMADFSIGILRIPNTTYAIIANRFSDNIIFNFEDITEPYEYFKIPPADQTVAQIGISLHYRIMLSCYDKWELDYFLKINKYPCVGPCSNCHEFIASQCLECKQNSTIQPDNSCLCNEGFYEEKGECLPCVENCLHCDKNGCISCKDNMTMTDKGTCQCIEGYWNKNSESCETCQFPCIQCEKLKGAKNSLCLICNNTYYLNNSECLDCSIGEGSPNSCPKDVSFRLMNTSITEKSHEIVIEFDRNLEKELKDEEIKKINFTGIFNLKKYSNQHRNYEEIKITKNFYSEGKLTLFFEEYLLHRNNPNLTIETIYPFNKFYNSSDSPFLQEQPLTILYFKIKSLKIDVKAIDKFENYTEEERAFEEKKNEAKEAAKLPKKVVPPTGLIVSIVASLAGSSYAFIFKFFQILEVLSNFSKINVSLGKNLEILLVFLNEIEFMEFDKIIGLSPIKDKEDSGEINEDRDLYLKSTRGIRGKIPESNKDIFIFFGQNYFLIMTLLVTWGLSFFIYFNSNIDTKLSKFIITVYRIILGFFYFDFQIITIAEVAIRQPMKDQRGHLRSSYYASMIFLVILILDIMRGSFILERKKGKEDKSIRYEDKLILEYYTSGLCKEAIIRGEKYLIFEYVRFFIIQVLITTLQLYKTGQAFLIVVANLIFFIYFMKKVRKGKLFESKIFTIKYLTSEICILVVLINIFIASLFEDKVKESTMFTALEILSIICIIVASLFEFVEAVRMSIIMVVKLVKKYKKSKVKQKNKVDLVKIPSIEEVEFDNENFPSAQPRKYSEKSPLESDGLQLMSKRERKSKGVKKVMLSDLNYNFRQMRSKRREKDNGKNKRSKEMIQGKSELGTDVVTRSRLEWLND